MPPAAGSRYWSKKRNDPNICSRKRTLGGYPRGLGNVLAIVDSVRNHAGIRIYLRIQGSGEAAYPQLNIYLMISGTSVEVHDR